MIARGRVTCGGAWYALPRSAGVPWCGKGLPLAPHRLHPRSRDQPVRGRKSPEERKLRRMSLFGLLAGTVLVVAIILAFWLLASFIEDLQRVARRR